MCRKRRRWAPGSGRRAPNKVTDSVDFEFHPKPGARRPARGAKRPGSVLLSSVLILLALSTLVAATLPLGLSGYALAREERDRVAALAAAEAGINWQIARIRAERWGRDDHGRPLHDLLGRLRRDWWPLPRTLSATASEHVLLEDADGQWRQRFVVGVTADLDRVREGEAFDIVAEGQVRAADGRIIRRRVRVGAVLARREHPSLTPLGWWRGRRLGRFKPGDWAWEEIDLD